MGYKKILYGLLTISCAIVAAVVVTLLYIYYHPATLKAVIERSLAAKLGNPVKIEALQYSIRPLSLQANNIVVNTNQSLTIKIPRFTAGFDLSGPFGSRKLVIRKFRLENFSIDLGSDPNLPRFEKQQTPPNLFDRTFRRLFHYFFFKDLQIQSAEALNGFIRLQSAGRQLILSQIYANLNPDQLEIRGAASILQSPQDIVIRLPLFRVVADPNFYTGKTAVGGRIILPEISIESPHVRAGDIQGRLNWSYNSARQNIALESVDLLCRRLILTPKTGQETVLNDLSFKAGAVVDLQQKRVTISHWRLETENLLELQGHATGSVQHPYRLKIGLTGGRLLFRRLLPFYRNFMGLDSMPLNVSGSIGLTGAIDVQKTQPGWSYTGDLTARLDRNAVSFSTDRIRLLGSINGNIRAAGPLAAPDLSATLTGKNLTMTGHGTEIKSMAASVFIAGTYPQFSITDMQAHMPGVSLMLGGKPVQMEDVAVHLKNGRVNLKSGNLACPEIKLSSSVLKNLQISLQGHRKQMMLNLEAKNSHVLEAAAAYGLIPSTWKISGQDTIQATAVIKQDGWSTISSKLAMREVNLYNPDESWMAENLQVSAEWSVMVHLRDQNVKGTFSMALPKGEFLCDNIYLDMSQNTFSATGNGTYNGQDRSLQFAGVGFGLKDLLALDIHGSLQAGNDPPVLDLFIKLPQTAIQPVFHHFIAEPHKYEKPVLTDLEADGFISARLHVRLNGSDVTVKGNTGWHVGNLRIAKTGVALEGIDLNLPIWFQTLQPESGSETLRGRLSIQKLILPFLSEQPLVVSLKVRPDSIATAATARLLFQSGHILVQPLVIKNIYAAQPSLATGLDVNSILIDTFLNGIWPKPTGGVIQGKLERINFNNNNLSSRGTITAEIFGGQIIISDPGISGFFTAAPVLHLSARINDLNLEELTEDTAFGKIQGVLAGTINNLEIVK
ncbi:MAG: hypothetical protein PVI06_14985, partial [Desulfobacterales bacterium]